MKKTLSIILCVVIFLLPMCISASAVNKAAALPDLNNYSVLSTFSDGKRAIISACRNLGEDISFFSTTDGKKFDVIHSKDYLGICEDEGSYYTDDMYVETNEKLFGTYVFDDSKFTAIINKIKFIRKSKYDDKTGDVIETQETTSKAVVLETSDFKNIKKYNVPDYISNIENINMIKTSKDEYLISGTVYSGNDKADNIFYITKDFKAFDKYQAPLMRTNPTALGGKGCYDYSVLKNGVVITNNYYVAYGEGPGGQDPSFSNVYYTEDYKTYTKICSATTEDQRELPFVDDMPGSADLMVIDRQNWGTGKAELVLSAVNKTTGAGRKIFSVDFSKSSNRRYWVASWNGNYCDIFLTNYDNSVELFIIDLKTGKVEKRDTDFSICDLNASITAEGKGYIFTNDNAFILDHSKPEECKIISISDAGIIPEGLEYYAVDYYCIWLNDSVFLLSNIFDYEGSNGMNFSTKILEIPIETQQNKAGDLNFDNAVNSSDALMILQYSVGSIKLDDKTKAVADVTKDGQINSSDALKVLQYSVGQITEL